VFNESFFVPQLGSQSYTDGGMVSDCNCQGAGPSWYLPRTIGQYSGAGFADLCAFAVDAVSKAGRIRAGWVERSSQWARSGARPRNVCPPPLPPPSRSRKSRGRKGGCAATYAASAFPMLSTES